MLQSLVVQERPKYLQSQLATSDVFVPVELRSPVGFGVIAMPYANILESNRRIQMPKRQRTSFVAYKVISRDVGMARVDARTDRHLSAQTFEQFSYLLERSTQGEFCAGRVLDQNSQGSQIHSPCRLFNRARSTSQALLTASSAKRSRMQNQVIRAQGRAAFQLSAKRSDRLPSKLLVAARQIDQIIGMDDERLQVIFLAKPRHRLALKAPKRVRLPLPRACRKNLKCITAQPVGSLSGILHAPGN